MLLYFIRFDQLRVKRERHTGSGKGKQKATSKPQKQNESIGYLLFQAEIMTISGSMTCHAKSRAIKLSKFVLINIK